MQSSAHTNYLSSWILRQRSWFLRQFVCLFSCLNILFNNFAISRTSPKTECLTILRAATHETELGDHDFCISQSHYTDTNPTSRERAPTAEIDPGTSSPGVVRSTDWATALRFLPQRDNYWFRTIWWYRSRIIKLLEQGPIE